MTAPFGFSKYPQRPAPSAQKVGAALLQQRTQPAAGPMSPAPTPVADFAPGQTMPDTVTPRAQREQGARSMASPGQMDESGGSISDGEPHSINAVNVAVGEALTRMGGGYNTNPNPFKPRDRNFALLRQHGLSETEAQLLIRTGGV